MIAIYFIPIGADDWQSVQSVARYMPQPALSFGDRRYPYPVFYDDNGQFLPVVEGVLPTLAADGIHINYHADNVLIAQFDHTTKQFIDAKAGLLAPPSRFIRFGEIKGDVLSQSNPNGDYFVYGYEVIDIGRLGTQLLPSHLAEQVRIFQQQTVPRILENASQYAALATEMDGQDPYNIGQFSWAADNLERQLVDWQFPNYINTVIPPPGSVETSIGRLHDLIAKGDLLQSQNGRITWRSADSELILSDIDDLLVFMSDYGVHIAPEQLVDHLLGELQADDTLSAAQRFMLLAALDLASAPVVVDANGMALSTSDAGSRIEFDRSSILVSYIFDVPQQMRGFWLHELGGHGVEFWGATSPCFVSSSNRRTRIEPMRYITELNDVLVLNPRPNPIALRQDYATTAATIMFFTQFDAVWGGTDCRDYSE